MKIKFFFFLLILFKICILKADSNDDKESKDTEDEQSFKNFLSELKQILNNSSIEDLNTFLDEAYKSFSEQIMKNIINKAQKKNVSNSCIEFLNIYFGNNSNFSNNINSNFFDDKLEIFSDFLQSSSLDRNALNYFEGCSKIHNSSYFILEIDASKFKPLNLSKHPIKKTILNYEDSFFIYGLCLPYIANDLWCSADDYKNIFQIMNKIMDYYLFPDGSDIKVYSIKLNINSPILAIIILVILAINFLFITFSYPIFLLLKHIFKKEKITNKIRKTKEENDNTSNETDNNKYEIPKTLIKLNNCFSLRDNAEELFNLKSNSTEVNDYSGITEIRGINGLSMIFTELGITFIVIYNSPLKVSGITQMRIFFKHILYILIFIGIRYSPRIMFSCSGYTLSYKYLCFIRKNSEGFYMLKFIFYQSHKYLILIILILFTRYSLNIIEIKIMGEESPNWAFFQESLVKNYKDNYKYWLSFFGIDLFFEDKKVKSDQNLTDYFWIPFNEIYFFLFGVILITFGYRRKFKIDIFIIFLIIGGFAGKIIFSYYYRDNYYSTLYYYLFDYGEFMLNPLFNFPYFLIGLYFGLMNFALQNSAINQYDNNIYKAIKNLSFDNIEVDQENIISKNDIIENNNDEDNKDKENNKEEIFDDKSDDNKKIEFNEISNNIISNLNEKNNNNLIHNIEDNKIIDNKTKNSTAFSEFDSSEKKNILPFLNIATKYINYIKNHKKQYIIFFVLIIIYIIFYFIVLGIFFNDGKIDDKKKLVNDNGYQDKDLKDLYFVLNLEDFISNKYLNAIFRIDIEIFILAFHWFIFNLKVNGEGKILRFFRNMLFGIFSKSYFSFTIVCNIVILFIIYTNETIISVNIYMVLLFFLLNLAIIFFYQFLSYVYLEIPLKKIIRYLCNRDDERESKESDIESYDNYFEEEEKDNNIKQKEN